MTRWLRARWVLDRVAAAVLVVVTAPLSAAIWLVVRVVDGPPAVVRLPRIGQGGEEFAMDKFRSMTVQSATGHAGGAALTMGADPRVTPLGRRLRHYRLDELPQLVNVLRGEMALLGPRPETPLYVDLDDERWQAVVAALPGIAGPTQVLIHDFEAGLGVDDLKRYEAEMVPVKLAIDQWYLAKASPVVDLCVLLALVQRFLLRRSTTTLHGRLEREIPEVADLLERHRVAPSSADGEPAEERVPERAHVRPRRRLRQRAASR
ncbi:MAG: sugar transferase [Acidimicrobiales bacterium]|nr:sugar transferase [Acidimicrobiales bacterium]